MNSACDPEVQAKLVCACLQGKQFVQCRPRVSLERGGTRRVEHISGFHYTLAGQRHRRARSVI